jgi:putative flippase GtrA
MNLPSRSRLPIREVLRFGFSGLASVGAYLGCLHVLIRFIDQLWLAGAIAYVLSMLVNYTLQRKLTFKSDRSHGQAAPRYLLVHAVGVAITGTTLEVGVSVLGFPLAIVQIVGVLLAAGWSYVGQKTWVFTRLSQTEYARKAGS